MSVSKLRELVMDREAWRAAAHAVTKTQDWATELNWGKKKTNKKTKLLLPILDMFSM